MNDSRQHHYNDPVKRIGRILLWTFVGLSLLLSIATLLLWVRSYWRTDQIKTTKTTHAPWPPREREMDTRDLSLTSSGGRLRIWWERHWIVGGRGNPESDRGLFPQFRQHPWDLARNVYLPGSGQSIFESHWGFRWVRWAARWTPTGKSPHIWVLVFPHALPVLLFAIPPAAMALAIRRRSKRKGLCPGCGYDLRMTPDRCPECGRETATIP